MPSLGIALDLGTSGFRGQVIDLSRDVMADYRQDLLDAMPDAQSVMVLVFRVNRNHLET